jgi:hypothetical protein
MFLSTFETAYDEEKSYAARPTNLRKQEEIKKKYIENT